MFKNVVSVIVAVTVFGSSVLGGGTVKTDTADYSASYSISSFLKKIKHQVHIPAPTQTTTMEEKVTEQETTMPETTRKEQTAEERTTEEQTAIDTTTMAEEEAERETIQEETVEQPEINQKDFHNANIYNHVSYYKEMAEEEAEWLWSQQMSNGAFAFYNADNGSVYINPYFSEIVAIALINYDNSEETRKRIEDYFDWHLEHINTAEADYNGLAGTIYDYDVEIVNGIVMSETSRGSYDSTDSYSALFVKALADYAKTYGDKSYLQRHESLVKDITNVMFATMSEGYTYAKPDYKIKYLMDNTEVYAGLVSAKYIYTNVIDDKEMREKVCNAVEFYDKHFNEHWWKGDHYASVLNSDYSEYTGYEFSWDKLYPCAAAQIYPILYGLIDTDSTYAKTVYEGLCGAWNWQEMDYISKGETVFCWGNFAYLGGLMDDEEKLNSYMNKYGDIVERGRKYPLYSSESAMVLMGCGEMIKQLGDKIIR